MHLIVINVQYIILFLINMNIYNTYNNETNTKYFFSSDFKLQNLVLIKIVFIPIKNFKIILQ